MPGIEPRVASAFSFGHPGRFRLGNEDGTVAAPRRRYGEVAEPRTQDQLHFVEVEWPDRSHRLELRQCGEHPVGLAELFLASS